MRRRGERARESLAGPRQEITALGQVQALVPRFENVNEAMQAQATGAEQISDALLQLTESAQQTVESLRQSNHAIDGLNETASDMRTGVSRFKLAA